MSDEVNITVHIAPNASPETLQALSDMMKCLIKAFEEGTIGIDQGKPGSDVTVLAEIKDGKVIRDYQKVVQQSAQTCTCRETKKGAMLQWNPACLVHGLQAMHDASC